MRPLKNTNLYSRLALATSVTLVVGYFVVYAAYQTFQAEEYQSGASLSSTFLGKIVSNLDEINGKISNFGFSGGNIGIGTASPQRELHINSTNGAQIELQGTTGSWDGLQFINTGYNGYTGLMESDGRFFIDTASNGEDFTVLQNGNVGIGTIAPTQKLDVAGRITTSATYGNGMGWSHMINAGQNMSFLVRNGGLYRLTIKASQSSVAAYIGQYLVYGLNKGAGSNPVVVTAGQSAATDWTFSYTLNGTYDANMIITAGTWTNQGLYIIVEKLYDY